MPSRTFKNRIQDILDAIVEIQSFRGVIRITSRKVRSAHPTTGRRQDACSTTNNQQHDKHKLSRFPPMVARSPRRSPHRRYRLSLFPFRSGTGTKAIPRRSHPGRFLFRPQPRPLQSGRQAWRASPPAGYPPIGGKTRSNGH